ncbi:MULTISPECIES: hypothetical protein [unclassified Ochrobactrum]|uniref:hypothetical protein n=1 Tax=unclassified Ochrobactrum TaxID=239106 RepID=UPI0030AB00C7
MNPPSNRRGNRIREDRARAQQLTLQRVRLYIAKAHFCDRFRSLLNLKQHKVVARLFEAGPDGFIGGLSAENYLAIT